MTEKVKYSPIGIFLGVVFIFIQLLFQYNLFNMIFFLLLILMVTVVFLREVNRVFVWSMVSFSGGLFAFIYGDRLLLELPLSYGNTLIANRLLLLIPIFLMSYVIYKFRENVIPYWKKPNWDLPSGSNSLSVKGYYIVVLVILLLVLLIAVFNDWPAGFGVISSALLFSIINGVLVEVLWRGILFTRMEKLLGYKLAIFFTSLSCSLMFFLLGFTIEISAFYFFISVLLGFLTYKTASLFPGTVLNILFTLVLVFLNVIPLLSTQ